MEIKINTPTWGDATSSNVAKILYSVSGVMDSCFGSVISEDLWVHQNITGNPMVLPVRGSNGEYLIQLSTTDFYWAQYSFQFAHEYCHVRTNYENTHQKFKWFEETVCELASLYFLRKMSEIWVDRPPWPALTDFAQHLFDYTQLRIDEPLHQLPENVDFKDWFRGKISELEVDQYIRKYNTLIAVRILALFENDSKLWEAMAYLNTWDTSADNDLYDFFISFRNSVPDECKSSIAGLSKVFID